MIGSHHTDQKPLPALIIDAHEDIAWNWLDLGRHPAESALASREREANTSIPAAMGIRTTGRPEWLAGRVGIIFATLFAMPLRHATSPWYGQTYASAEEAHSTAARQLDAYHELATSEPGFALITNRDELKQVADSWQPPAANPVIGLVMLMEGADPIREPAEVHHWHGRGVRIVGPSWCATRYAGGTKEPGPLTPLGRELLAEMASLNMVLDLSHMAEQAYWQALESYDGSLIASHSNPRRFRPSDRNLSDEMIRALAGRGGVIGVAPFNLFLLPDWRLGDPREHVSIQLVADVIDHIVQLTGSTAHVGLGTDFDGAFGAESIPAGMDTVADLPLIADLLHGRGYDSADIEQIMSGNWLRVLQRSLPQQ